MKKTNNKLFLILIPLVILVILIVAFVYYIPTSKIYFYDAETDEPIRSHLGLIVKHKRSANSDEIEDDKVAAVGLTDVYGAIKVPWILTQNLSHDDNDRNTYYYSYHIVKDVGYHNGLLPWYEKGTLGEDKTIIYFKPEKDLSQ